MMMGLFCLVLLGTGSNELARVDDCDAVEFNCYYDCKGKLVFRQMIFWNLRYVPNRPKVWRGPWQPWQTVCDGWRIVGKFPLVERRGNRYVITFHDGRDGSRVLRRIVTGSVFRSWTQIDPERVNRAVWPENRRSLHK